MTNKVTVGEIRSMLHGLPDSLPVEFSPITSAFLGCEAPLRVYDISFYEDLEHAQPDDENAYACIYIREDR
ncbi:MAG: hypothetical protein AAF434_17400 [Pseudomonadota bacterium]